MKKCLAWLSILCLVVCSGCQGTAEEESSSLSSLVSEESGSVPSEPSDLSSHTVFEPYQVYIPASGTDVYTGPGYDYPVMDFISEEGTYWVINDATETSQNTTTYWAQLEMNEGWINLNDLGNTGTENYLLPFSSSRLVTESDLQGFSPSELVLARNEIYARHGRLFQDPTIARYFQAQTWYNGIIAADDFSEDVLSEIEVQNIRFIKEYQLEVYGDEVSVTLGEEDWYENPGTDVPPESDESSQEPSSNHGSGGHSSSGSSGSSGSGSGSGSSSSSQTPSVTPDKTPAPLEEDEPKVTSVKVKNVTFNYVQSYEFSGYNGEAFDYDMNISVKYCEPKQYMSDQDHIMSIHRSGGLYKKEEIGSLYLSAGTDDFAVFEITVSGQYVDEFEANFKNIEYRHYTSAGTLLKDVASGITDYELVALQPGYGAAEGQVKKTFYMGFYTSEVGRVDFKILGVGPHGFGGW